MTNDENNQMTNIRIYKRIISLIAILLVSIFSLSACFHREKGASAARLTFYGLDDSDVIEPFINAYRKTHGNVTITYKKFSDPNSFENLVINEIAEGEGPDIFYIHNTWLPRHLKKLVPLNPEALTIQTFSDVFVKVVSDDFVQKNPVDGTDSIYAVPLYVDTLALYYNKDEYERLIPERGKPAATWDEFKKDAEKFSSVDSDGNLTSGAVAMGRSDNIKLAADILNNFFVQSGEIYTKDFKKIQLPTEAQEFFDYFLSFARPLNKNVSWSEKPADEVTAFLSGKVASMFGYSDFVSRIPTELKNARSKAGFAISADAVAVAPTPQMKEGSEQAVWANYYGLGVSRTSKNSAAAWDFIQFIGSKANATQYLIKTNRPTARRDLIEEQRGTPMLEVFIVQLGYAKSFPIFSDQRFALVMREAINNAVNGQNPRQALTDAQNKLNEALGVEAPQGLFLPLPKIKR